mgnify:CR=1 FL=1
MGLFEKLFGTDEQRQALWDDAEARNELSKGDVRHVYVKKNGNVNVSRYSHGPRAERRTRAKADRIEDDIRRASRCKPGRKAGAPVYRKVDADELPPVQEKKRRRRW